MKILIIHPYSFSDYKGGVEFYCRTLVEGLTGYKNLNVSQINGHYFKLFGEPLPKIKIFQAIKKEKPDIVHLQGPRPFATMTGFFGKILGRKPLLTYHAHLNPKNFIKKIIANFDRLILKYIFDLIIVTSDNYKNKVGKFFPKERIKTIPLLVEDDFFQYQETKNDSRRKLSINEKKIILFVGKLDKHHYYKGVDILIKSVKLLRPDIKVIIIGDGDKRKEYENLAGNLGLENRVIFKGEIEKRGLLEYYRAADLLVLPSISDSEGFGLVLLEAMAMGLPIITTDLTGSAPLIKEKNAGIIIPANNPELLAEAIKKLLQDFSLYQKLQENGKLFAKGFRIKENINQFLEAYQCLLRQ